jgi:phage/plasmid-like protein (TIGR03299 family)
MTVPTLQPSAIQPGAIQPGATEPIQGDTAIEGPELARMNAFGTLGDLVEGMTVEQALEEAKMNDWNVRKIPHRQIVALPEGGYTEVQVPDTYTVLRTNPGNGKPEALGSVGNRWTPFQNEDCANLCRDITTMSGASPYAMGVTNGGRKTFMAMKLPKGFTFASPRTGVIDTTDLFLVVFNSHDGYGSLTANLTPVRMFCCNQQRTAESMARTRFALRHTGDADERMAQLRELLNESYSYHDIYQKACEAQIERELDEDMVLHELNKLLKASDTELTDRQREIRGETVSAVLGIYNTSETVAPFHGTAYGLLNAITEYTDHHMRVVVRGTDDVRAMRAMRTMNSWQLDEFKQNAFTQLLPADAAKALAARN